MERGMEAAMEAACTEVAVCTTDPMAWAEVCTAEVACMEWEEWVVECTGAVACTA